MASLLRWVVISVAFWVMLNALALYQLNGGRVRKQWSALLYRRSNANSSEEPFEVESEDSSQDSSAGSEGASVVDGSRVQLTRGPSPAAKKKAVSDPLPRSIGNSETAAVTEPVFYPHHSALSFFVIGDWGGPGRQPQRNVAKAMDTIATEGIPVQGVPPANIDFIISTGDNMYEDGVSSDRDAKFKRNFEDVYTHKSLQRRWYMSFGNHDHGAHGVMRNAQAEVNYTKKSRRWFLPSTYYTQKFIVGQTTAGKHSRKGNSFEVELFVLDTYDYSPRVTRMTEQQLKWFELVLANSTADVKLVVGHRPLFSAGAKHGSSPYMQKKLEPLFRTYGVGVYMCGDDHELQVMRSQGVLYVLSGGGARAKKDLKPNGIPQTVFQAGVHGFMHAVVNATTFSLWTYNQIGELLHRMDHALPQSHHHKPKKVGK